MSLPVVCHPPVLKALFKPYKACFSKPQFKQFVRLVTGLLVGEQKSLQEINDLFGECDQSSLNRFVNSAPFDEEFVNDIRLQEARKLLPKGKKGFLIIDESLLHKTGQHMELAGVHRSGVTKKFSWGHMMVNCFYADLHGSGLPVQTTVYVREKDCDKYNRKFLTKREIAVMQVDYALLKGLPFDLVLADAGYEGEEFFRELIDRGLKFVVGVRTSTNISIDRKKRVSIAKYLETLSNKDFEVFVKDGKKYFYHVKTVSLRGVGQVKLVTSYIGGDEENVKCYITNLEEKNENVIRILLHRWDIEVFHRDAKQHLGLEAYQVRKSRGMQIVALASLTAYTLARQAAKKLSVKLSSIGEICRYLKLVTYKGTRWLSQLLKQPKQFLKVLKRHVLIKNAKV